MEINYESGEIFNSAFINPSDLEYSPSNSSQLNLSNCYLDPTEFSFEISKRRFAKSISPSKRSPQSLKRTLSNLECTNFDLPDSCLLFTSQENLESYQQSNSFLGKNEKLPELEIKELTENYRDITQKVNCKDFLNFLIRPFSSKFLKKINKKLKKPFNQEETKIQAKIPIQLYSSNKTNTGPKQEKSNCKINRAYSQRITGSKKTTITKLNQNNFLNCGDLVTYFV